MNGERRFRVAVLGACLVHAALLLLHAPQRHALPAHESRLPSETLVGVELALTRQPQPPASDQAQRTPEPTQPELPATALSSVRPRLNGPESNVTANGPDTTTGTPSSATSLEGNVANGSSPGAPSTDSATGNARRALPRTKGNGDDFALAYAMSKQEKAPGTAEVAADRLRQSMQQNVADADRELGLHVPAPLMLALESAAREVAIPTNSVALFTANIDGSGNLLGLEFGGSNHASPQWDKLSQRVQLALRGHKLTIAKNTKGVDFKLRLVARSQLPSGADPGLGVDLLGLPVKKGQGKRSSKLSILDPTPVMLEYEIPGTDGQEKVKIPVPGVVFNVLSVVGDPADIGAPARHMIRVQVIDEKIY